MQIFKSFIRFFIKGLLFILPILIVVSILRQVFSILFPIYVGNANRIIIAILAVAIITFTGFIISKGAGYYLKRKSFKTLSKFPFAAQVFASARKFFLLLNFSKEIFDKPVMVKRDGNKEIKLGFVTNSDLNSFGLKDHSSVYLPNPFSFLGELVIVANRDLMPIHGEKSDISNFILSGGLIKK